MWKYEEAELCSFFDSMKNDLDYLALPQCWNANRTSYILDYVHGNEKFQLNAFNFGGSIQFILMNTEGPNSHLIINLDTVKSMNGALEASVPDYKLVINEINEKLISPFFSIHLKGTNNAWNLTSVALGVCCPLIVMAGLWAGIACGYIDPKTK